MTILRISAAFCAAFLAIIGAAWASGDDVFVVPRVTVQAQADNATAAKTIAQRSGRRHALELLLRRLTIEEDWPYLPRIGATEPAVSSTVSPAGPNDMDHMSQRTVLTLDDSMLEALESGFEVYNEKSSARTYRAYITYRFKPASIRKLLRDAQIPYSEAQTRMALVLPVLETQTGLYLWEENNPWMAAWKVRPYNNELTPMTAPLGDLEDAATISPRQALALNEAALAAMAERYSVSQIIVAHAFLKQVDGQHQLRVRLINGFRESADFSGDAELTQVNAQDGQFGFGDVQQGPSTNGFTQAQVGDILAQALFNREAGNFPALAEEAIEVVIAKHAKPWKERTLIDHTEAALLEASAYFASLGEWSKIRSALISTPLVGSVQVRSLSRTGAEMLIRAYGDPEKLIIAMESQGLALWTEDGESWMVATPSRAQTIRGSRRSKRNRFGEMQNGALPVQPAAYEGPQQETRY